MSWTRRCSPVIYVLQVSVAPVAHQFGRYIQLMTVLLRRARRNSQGHLEPDAADDVVQKSLGFDKYENAPKKSGESGVASN